jgi:hypothetical protein
MWTQVGTFGPWLWGKIARRRKEPKKEPLSEADLKARVQILFIDDEQFEYIDTIRNAGWNVQQMEDIANLDDERLRRAHIIFLDYKGVGQHLSPREGIGLLKAIQTKYPKKIIIFYSAHAGFSLGDEFHSADDWLLKHFDPYVYLQKIEENARKLDLQ